MPVSYYLMVVEVSEMKLSRDLLKKIIKEELNEIEVNEIFGFFKGKDQGVKDPALYKAIDSLLPQANFFPKFRYMEQQPNPFLHCL